MFGRKKKEILTSGIQARAVITRVEDTGVTINENPRVKLTLQVQPDGELPFEVTKKLTDSRISIPTIGSTMWVRFDPNDRSRVEFDEAKTDQVNTTAQVTLGSAVAGPAAPTPTFDGGATVIDARAAPGLREEMLKAISDVRAGGNPAELQDVVMKAMSQGTVTGASMDAAAVPGTTPSGPTEDPLDRLEKLAKLHESGALTDAEFQEQKAKILGET